MNFSKGFIVRNPENIKECFAIEGDNLLINLSSEKYQKVVNDLVECLPIPAFMAYEVPCNELKEKELRKSNQDPFHNDVYYIDGMDHKIMQLIMEKMGDMLINDGLTQFAFGGLETQEEIVKAKYNLLIIIAKDFSKYIGVLNKHGIEQVDQIVTARDTFTEEHPGMCQKYIDEKGRDSYDLRDIFIEMGAYLDHVAEQK